jgi:hypothetical protein
MNYLLPLDKMAENQPRDPAGTSTGGQWSAGGGGGSSVDASKDFRTRSKGTDDAVNARVVKESGVKMIAPQALQRDATEALAHVIADSKSNTVVLQKITVEFKEMPGRHGTQKMKTLYISAESLRAQGPGFAASIIRHELEHKRLTDRGVSSAVQEGRVRHIAGMWAAMRYSSVATTNPRAARGFKEAALEQGVKVR